VCARALAPRCHRTSAAEVAVQRSRRSTDRWRLPLEVRDSESCYVVVLIQ
jgi:hypothetical protein